MADVQTLASADEVAGLRAEVDALRGLLTGRQARLERRPWRRAKVIAGVTLAGAMVMGMATASTPGHPADVTYISLSVPHKILSGAYIGKGATISPVAIGGSTTVPTDATSVQMTVAVKSTAAGSLSVFPTDHASSTTADTISFSAGSVVTTQVSKQSPGLSNKVSFKNGGTATAIVTVTITGYSTQTTASNISGSGGVAEQVLTNTGTGAQWKTPTPTYGSKNPDYVSLTGSPTITSVTVPAGSYALNAATTAFGNGAPSYGYCFVVTPGGVILDDRFFNLDSSIFNTSMALQGLLQTTGGRVFIQCSPINGSASVYNTVLTLTRVGSVSGGAVALGATVNKSGPDHQPGH